MIMYPSMPITEAKNKGVTEMGAEDLEKAMKTAEVLVEALPYIKKFAGKTIVIKYGGHAMNNDAIKEKVISDIVLMKYVGINPVIVHGGGPAINYWVEKNGGEPQFINGLRVTDKDTMDIAQMVLVGRINQEIVGLIQKLGGKAVGITGIDGHTGCVGAELFCHDIVHIQHPVFGILRNLTVKGVQRPDDRETLAFGEQIPAAGGVEYVVGAGVRNSTVFLVLFSLAVVVIAMTGTVDGIVDIFLVGDIGFA